MPEEKEIEKSTPSTPSSDQGTAGSGPDRELGQPPIKKKKSRFWWVLALAALLLIFLSGRFGISDDFNLPRGSDNSSKIMINDKEISITEGVKHTIPLEEILSGGPPKDGIPSIDAPKFISTVQADEFLKDDDVGLALKIGDTARFYPFLILVWHEIVNDTIPAPSGVEGDGQRVLVTYCPLCLTGIVFDPVVNGQRVEFGVSGKLWNSNLLMYDRKTDSLWSQVLAEAVVGEMTGTKLEVLPSDIVKYGSWKNLHRDGQVLSRDTGAARIYGQDPYGSYYTTPGTYFPLSNEDKRLADKEFVLGIVVDGKAKAYVPGAVKQKGRVEDNFQGKTIVARYEEDIDAVRLYEKTADGGLQRLNPIGAFWFSWAAAHPDTELYPPS